MEKIGIFYGSTDGSTAEVAGLIADELTRKGVRADLMNIAHVTPDMINKYENIILGASTWGMGVLQADWEDMLDHISRVDFHGKTVALFGTGDQESYPDTFVDGLGVLYEIVASSEAYLVGRWSADGYKFRESMAMVGDDFAGLVLDEDTQPLHTRARISAWVNGLLGEFGSKRN